MFYNFPFKSHSDRGLSSLTCDLHKCFFLVQPLEKSPPLNIKQEGQRGLE